VIAYCVGGEVSGHRREILRFALQPVAVQGFAQNDVWIMGGFGFAAGGVGGRVWPACRVPSGFVSGWPAHRFFWSAQAAP